MISTYEKVTALRALANSVSAFADDMQDRLIIAVCKTITGEKPEEQVTADALQQRVSAATEKTLD